MNSNIVENKNNKKNSTTSADMKVKSSPNGEGFQSDDKMARLEQCEKTIQQNEEGIFSIGRNLSIINAQNLYKAGEYTSFEKYCRERWGMSYQHAYRLMNAAKCYDILAKHEKEKDWILPRNEAQIRELAALPETDWERTWTKFLKKIAGNTFTAEDVEAFIKGGDKKKKTSPEKENVAADDDDTQASATTSADTETLRTKLEEVNELIDDALELTNEEEVRELLEKIKALIENNG